MITYKTRDIFQTNAQVIPNAVNCVGVMGKGLAEKYAELGISSHAPPFLGCGLGGLDCAQFKILIDKYLGPIDDLDVYVYETEAIISNTGAGPQQNLLWGG